MNKFLTYISRPSLNLIDFVNIVFVPWYVMSLFNSGLFGIIAGILACLLVMIISIKLEIKYYKPTIVKK